MTKLFKLLTMFLFMSAMFITLFSQMISYGSDFIRKDVSSNKKAICYQSIAKGAILGGGNYRNIFMVKKSNKFVKIRFDKISNQSIYKMNDYVFASTKTTIQELGILSFFGSIIFGLFSFLLFVIRRSL